MRRIIGHDARNWDFFNIICLIIFRLPDFNFETQQIVIKPNAYKSQYNPVRIGRIIFVIPLLEKHGTSKSMSWSGGGWKTLQVLR